VTELFNKTFTLTIFLNKRHQKSTTTNQWHNKNHHTSLPCHPST